MPRDFRREEQPQQSAFSTNCTDAETPTHANAGARRYYRCGDREIVRMEDCTLVDCTRRGGNNALVADSVSRALIVMCDGHGSLSMLGRNCRDEICLGGAEMARLAAHSLANELFLENSSLTDAFRKTSATLLRHSFEGAARHSLLGQSLLDGAYFRWLLETLKKSDRVGAAASASSSHVVERDTVVSKTCEMRDDTCTPTVRYVTQSGERIEPVHGTTATVVECTGTSIRVCNVGNTLVALYSPRTTPINRRTVVVGGGGGGSGGGCSYSHCWLTESHSVHNTAEVKRMRQKHQTRLESGRFVYRALFRGSGSDGGRRVQRQHSADGRSKLVDDTEVCRLSRSLGHQCLRAQGMLDSPGAVLVQKFAVGQIAVIATAGVWNAFGDSGGDDNCETVGGKRDWSHSDRRKVARPKRFGRQNTVWRSRQSDRCARGQHVCCGCHSCVIV